MERVAVLAPVLNRPQRAATMRESLGDTAPVFWLVSPGDDDEIQAVHEHRRPGDEIVLVPWEPGPGDYARKINQGAKLAANDGFGWVFTGADDLTFHDGWLDAAWRVHTMNGCRVVGTNDLWNPMVRSGRHSTHTLVKLDYVMEQGASWDGPGVLLHEGYDHQCVDNELVAAAQMRGEFAFAKHSIVEHLHPFAKKAEMDSTYEKALAKGRQDIQLFRVRLSRARADRMRSRR